jgi:hypothetical protein
MFDAFKQAKLQNAYQSMKEYKSIPEKDMSLDDLKRLSGVNNIKAKSTFSQIDKSKYMRENNIKPGSDAWFKLWFAKPDITGENPFS